jgi:dephospho-CoA kinase
MALVLGVTGGIGTGKSTVLSILAKLGAATMSADEIAREVLAKDTSGYHETIQHFGRSILAENGEIDRAALGAIVFADSDARAALNSITHPRIIELMYDRIADYRRAHLSPSDLLAVEIPLLIECGLEGLVDQVLLVAAEQETRVGRLTSSKGIARGEAESRIASQLPIREKLSHAHWVIWNDGSLHDLEEQVASIWQSIRLGLEG